MNNKPVEVFRGIDLVIPEDEIEIVYFPVSERIGLHMILTDPFQDAFILDKEDAIRLYEKLGELYG
jgi:hypothetical protein